ncbi:MAG: 30S ribosomal protein S6 [Calditrichia bacterium]|nr:30S ribosomal protein S6 [Calditrichia bacterium]
MALYETIFILDSLLPPEEIDKQVDRVKELLETNNCKVIEIDRWGKRRLAYEIQKKQYGYYVVIEFDSDGTAPQLLSNEFNYNDKVLRYMTYRFNKNIIKDRAKSELKAAKETKELEEKIDEKEAKVEPVIEAKKVETAEEGKETENEKTNE